MFITTLYLHFTLYIGIRFC